MELDSSLFTYISLGGIFNPKNRNILFLGDEFDLKKYSESVCYGIFKVIENVNVLIPKQLYDGEVKDYLSDFDMVVILVSNRLLCSDGIAKTFIRSVLARADANILPIAVEDAVDVAFVDKCNELLQGRQFLSLFSHDVTEIPYEIKLRSKINRDMVRNEDDERIRENFPVRLFISYRKRDRAKLIELLKLIRLDIKLKWVGIWYDENIIPGSDFEQAIRSNIASSDLFLLLLTGNMLERGNYVIENEYKYANGLARGDALEIVAVLWESLDMELVRKSFEDVEKRLESKDNIVKYLSERMDQNAIGQRSLYLLALAYYYGVGAERDKNIAIDLFRRSYEDGNKEALRYLASLNRNNDSFVSLQREFISTLEVVQPDDLEKVTDAYIELIQYYIDNGKFKEARNACFKCINLLAPYFDRSPFGDKANHQYLRVYQILAFVFIKREKKTADDELNDINEAYSCYRKGIIWIPKLNHEDVEALKTISIFLNNCLLFATKYDLSYLKQNAYAAGGSFSPFALAGKNVDVWEKINSMKSSTWSLMGLADAYALGATFACLDTERQWRSKAITIYQKLYDARHSDYLFGKIISEKYKSVEKHKSGIFCQNRSDVARLLAEIIEQAVNNGSPVVEPTLIDALTSYYRETGEDYPVRDGVSLYNRAKRYDQETRSFESTKLLCRVLAVLTYFNREFKDETVQLFNCALRKYKGLFVNTYTRYFDNELYGNSIGDEDYEHIVIPCRGDKSADDIEWVLAGRLRLHVLFLGEARSLIQSKVVALKLSLAAYYGLMECGVAGLTLAASRGVGARAKTTPNEKVTFMLDDGSQVTMIRHYG